MTATRHFASALRAVQAAGEDFEWYPTTPRMVDACARWMDKGAASLMDIGAGDGRVLLQLAKHCTHEPLLYAIEKSAVLIQAQPENVIPVGTDLFEQDLVCLPVEYLFSNPPYSQFETWASVIIETGHAQKAFLVIPQRWKDSKEIAVALKKRGATARVIHSDNFLDGERRARAVVDVVEISYPHKDGYDWQRDQVKDPFDTWFDEHISTFDEEEPDDYAAQRAREEQGLARLHRLDTIASMAEAYDEEYSRMQDNYRAIFALDHALLKELGVKKDALRDGIKKKMAGLKSKYWELLFDRLHAITERLSTATKKSFLEKLTGRTAVAFTANNAYAIVLWAIKNANKYFDQQTVALYRALSTFEGVQNYKSNLRTWVKSGWRYRSDEFSHYALDYRVVLSGHGGISAEQDSYRSPGGLGERAHEIIADIRAVMRNLGFQSSGFRSQSIQWYSGTWENWQEVNPDKGHPILFQVKAYKNGNLHLRFAPDAIKALNVEAGRLLGWLNRAEDVVTELGYTPAEAKRFYSCTNLIAPSNIRLLVAGPLFPAEVSA